jgi:hypothetical protein
MSSAPASWQSSEAKMASISMCPIRPEAPATVMGNKFKVVMASKQVNHKKRTALWQ